MAKMVEDYDSDKIRATGKRILRAGVKLAQQMAQASDQSTRRLPKRVIRQFVATHSKSRSSPDPAVDDSGRDFLYSASTYVGGATKKKRKKK